MGVDRAVEAAYELGRSAATSADSSSLARITIPPDVDASITIEVGDMIAFVTGATMDPERFRDRLRPLLESLYRTGVKRAGQKGGSDG